jgi:hypothetical protein
LINADRRRAGLIDYFGKSAVHSASSPRLG